MSSRRSPYEQNKPQDRTNPSDHTTCGQRLDKIVGGMQSMRTDSECSNSTRTLTKLEDQRSQLMSMMGDIKIKIGTGTPSNPEDNPQREVNEHGKILSSLKTTTPEIIAEKNDDPQEVSLEVEYELEPEEVTTPAVETEKELASQESTPVRKYAKFLMEIIARHRKIKVGEQVTLNASCSVTILGQLVDRSLVRPKGVLEDVLVKVQSFIMPADFVVLDFDEDCEIPILLGRPFLATSRSTIDLEKNKLTMKVNGETETFKCGHQSSKEDRRKLGEQCKKIFISKFPKIRETLPFMHTEGINKFKEREK
ncbi:hypothetical protein EPI10_024997 [Gossypium australe]|uniref:Retrovirus-related Pol polyprotein from transposon opus n=1 Tax=Gossypium australe TaxID=47621 RepID=A0A5B6W0I8_9ROSI|nr:hypothetical protein EPI10_024997 [Gossypium australe]